MLLNFAVFVLGLVCATVLIFFTAAVVTLALYLYSEISEMDVHERIYAIGILIILTTALFLYTALLIYVYSIL